MSSNEFRPIRRKNKEISVELSKKLLKEARRGILAVNGDNDYPYAIPVNFYFDENVNKIYFHGSRAGHKSDALNKCNKVCFTVCGNENIKDVSWAPYVTSTVVFGRCNVITDLELAGIMLREFALKYYPDQETVEEEIKVSGKGVQMYEIEIEHISGKEVQER